MHKTHTVCLLHTSVYYELMCTCTVLHYLYVTSEQSVCSMNKDRRVECANWISGGTFTWNLDPLADVVTSVHQVWLGEVGDSDHVGQTRLDHHTVQRERPLEEVEETQSSAGDVCNNNGSDSNESNRVCV